MLLLAVAALLAAGLAYLPNSILPADMRDFVGGLAVGMGAALLLMLLVWLIKPLRSSLPDACASAPPALRRRYQRELMSAMGGYVLTLFVSIWLLKRVDQEWLRALLALLPIPAIALAMRAIVRYIRDTDELQRQIELEAVSFATALVSLAYLAFGLLQSAKVVDIEASAAMIWVFPSICLVYGIVKLLISRRYR